LEEELGGPLVYRDGKDSRLTALGQDVEMEFRRMQVALRNGRQHSDSWGPG
jgi:DNA-binding transcriptional LysR family regulator